MAMHLRPDQVKDFQDEQGTCTDNIALTNFCSALTLPQLYDLIKQKQPLWQNLQAVQETPIRAIQSYGKSVGIKVTPIAHQVARIEHEEIKP